MSKTSKIITGILSFLPLLLFAGYFITFFSMMFRLFSNLDPSGSPVPPENPDLFLSSFISMFAIMGLMVFASIGMLIYFIVHIANSKRLDNNERLIWILIVVFVGMFGFPIYWYLKIWKEEEVPQPPVL